MSIEETPLTEAFGQPETWENPYPVYRQFRESAPFVAQWPIVFLDGNEALVRTWTSSAHQTPASGAGGLL